MATFYKCPWCIYPITKAQVREACKHAEPSIVHVGTEIKRGWITAAECDPREPLAHRDCRDRWSNMRATACGTL